MRRLRALIEQFVRIERFGSEEDRSRARFIGWVGAVGAVISVVFSVLYLAADAWSDLSVSMSSIVVSVGGVLLFRRTGRFADLGHFAAAVQLVGFLIGVLATGDLVFVAWMALPPVLVAALAGSRAGYAWAIGSALVAAASVLCLEAHLVTPDIKPHASAARAWALVPLIGIIGGILQRGRERTIAVLEEARAAAEAANQSKTKFLASISHEIRTPLNGVLGVAELLLAETQEPAVRGRVETIHRSGELLLALINDLLDLSRAEAGKLEFVMRPAVPKKLIEQVLSLHEPTVKARGLSLTSAFEAEAERRLLLDPVRLCQVLHNLVGNALKFTERGNIHVWAGSSPLPDGRVVLQISVRDSGRGIRPEDRERLFQPFSQLKTADQQQGTGLGLAISKLIAQQQGGQLRLRHSDDMGSEFVLELPCAVAQDQTLTTPARGIDLVRLQGGRVLVVDDNLINAQVALAMLSRLGLGAEAVPDGAQALERLATQHFDLVLMDCQMPVMDGFEATRRLREREGDATVHTPVVALTASALPSELEACLAAGMDACLTKPLQLSSLRAILERLVLVAGNSTPRN
ncbi:MAG: response regulator [Myxococcaceae bacterium]|nr:response regulator [Myxococcaceae bacterium]